MRLWTDHRSVRAYENSPFFVTKEETSKLRDFRGSRGMLYVPDLLRFGCARRRSVALPTSYLELFPEWP